MYNLYNQGKVAILLGTGLPRTYGPADDHGGAQYAWGVGSVASGVNVGWVGSTMDQLHSPLNSMVSFRANPQDFIAATTSATILTTPIERNKVSYGPLPSVAVNAPTAGALMKTNDNAYALPYVPAELTRSYSSNVTNYFSLLTNLYGTLPDYPTTFSNPGAYGGLVKPPQFKAIAQFLAGGMPARAYWVIAPGYDTHATQNELQPNLLRELSEGRRRIHGLY